MTQLLLYRKFCYRIENFVNTDWSRHCRSLDRDQNGSITSEELQRALARLGVPVTEATAAQMVELIDTDQSSDVSYEEFRRFALLLPSSQVCS